MKSKRGFVAADVANCVNKKPWSVISFAFHFFRHTVTVKECSLVAWACCSSAARVLDVLVSFNCSDVS